MTRFLESQQFARLLALVVWIAVLASAAVWLTRISSAVAFDRPFLGCTSGCEEEAMFSVWKAANGNSVYNSPWLPPFSASYFGWLFYEVYGLWAKAGLALSGLDDAWLPTFTRFLTLLGLLACIGLFYCLLRTGMNRARDVACGLLFGFSTIVFVNPLFHWWSFTTRADIWALAFELAALLAGFRYAQSGGIRSVAAVGIFAFVAWSFRQTNISVLAGFGLWLMFMRQWNMLVMMVSCMAAAFGVTIAVLGVNFIDSAFTATALSGEMLFSVWRGNAFGALTKDPVFALGLGFTLVALVRLQTWWSDEKARLALLVSVTALVLASIFSAKVGASSNYYFSPAVLIPLFVIISLCSAGVPRWFSSAFVGASATATFIVSGLVLAGGGGNLRVLGDEHLQMLRGLRASLPQPVFATDRVANLPWILGSGSDSPVFGYAYLRMLEAKPERFAEGTIASQLRGGKYGSVVVADVNASYVLEPEELQAYVQAEGPRGYVIWKRKDSVVSNPSIN